MKLPSIKSITQSANQRRQAEYRKLIQNEAKIGGELFGPIPDGVRREFFCLDQNTWIWHEEWTDMSGQRRAVTTRYDVRPSGVLKVQDGQPYRELSREEAKNFVQAVNLYNERINKRLYAEVA